MSGTEPESLSERELAEDLFSEVFSGEPRSVGEALAAADAAAPVAEEIPEPPIEEPPLIVTDEPVQPTPPDDPTEAAPSLGEEVEEPTEVGEEVETEEEEDEAVVWAKKKYGDDPLQWARAARNSERHITRLTSEKQEAEGLAAQWYEYAQSLESQPQQPGMAMPLSQAEESWVEQAMADPLGYARHAAFNGNMQLYNAVLARVAEENAPLAANVGTQVQLDLQAAAQQEAMQRQPQIHPQAQLPIAIAQSFARLGLDLASAGPDMSAKIGELGEYHPYVQAILNGDDGQRDLAVQAVHDLMRSTKMTRRVVRDEQSADRIRREGELRREAASVVQGSPHTPPAQQDPFMQAMEDEWRQRGQWYEE